MSTDSTLIFPSRFDMCNFISTLNGLFFLELDLVEDPPDVKVLSAKMELLRPSVDIHYVGTQKDN